LAVAGFPLTPGFPARWGLIAALGNTDVAAAAIVVLGSVAVTAAGLRWAGFLLAQPGTAPHRAGGLAERLFLQGGILICIGLGSVPQLLYPWVVRATSEFTNLLH
jgi:NADH:ubiquinone oxidoreductase subunit 2 (subunit N)